MDPVAFHLGDLAIRWYGIMVACAFLAGFFFMALRSGRFHLHTEHVADLTLAAMLGGLIGARLLYVIRYWGEFQGNLMQIIRIDQGGLVFLGGFAGGVLGVLFVCRRKGWSAAVVGDMAAPALALGHAIGRVGCFLNGCCFGKPWSHFLSVSYPKDSYVSYVQAQKDLIVSRVAEPVAIFPIQLLASFIHILVCVGLVIADRYLPRRGLVLSIYLMAYGIVRFALEFGRGDYLNPLTPLTYTQWGCILIILVGIGLYRYFSRQGIPREAPAESD